jgi:hypothetical protein
MGTTLTDYIKTSGGGHFGATTQMNLDPPVCIASFDPNITYPPPPACQLPAVRVFSVQGSTWTWWCM